MNLPQIWWHQTMYNIIVWTYQQASDSTISSVSPVALVFSFPKSPETSAMYLRESEWTFLVFYEHGQWFHDAKYQDSKYWMSHHKSPLSDFFLVAIVCTTAYGVLFWLAYSRHNCFFRPADSLLGIRVSLLLWFFSFRCVVLWDKELNN